MPQRAGERAAVGDEPVQERGEPRPQPQGIATEPQAEDAGFVGMGEDIVGGEVDQAPAALAVLQTRLRKLGVPSARTARNGAWLSLVGAVHWKMLADLLGVADTTASAWHRENGGDRASYVASRLRQGQRTAGPE